MVAEEISRDGSSATTEGRLRAAAALRRLGNAFVAHQPEEDLLEEIATLAEALTEVVTQAPVRTHTFFAQAHRMFATEEPDAERAATDVFPDNVISGLGNPMGMEATQSMGDGEAYLDVTLGEAFEGAPGRAHGGVVAALFDDLLGMALSIAGGPAFTGSLTVTYRAPTPIGQAIKGRARLTERNGRKLTVTGELYCGETLLAEASGLFIAVDTTKFLQLPGMEQNLTA
jgi:acyl-coenzyme A thioesterase PaaI-like protein